MPQARQRQRARRCFDASRGRRARRSGRRRACARVASARASGAGLTSKEVDLRGLQRLGPRSNRAHVSPPDTEWLTCAIRDRAVAVAHAGAPARLRWPDRRATLPARRSAEFGRRAGDAVHHFRLAKPDARRDAVLRTRRRPARSGDGCRRRAPGRRRSRGAVRQAVVRLAEWTPPAGESSVESAFSVRTPDLDAWRGAGAGDDAVPSVDQTWPVPALDAQRSVIPDWRGKTVLRFSAATAAISWRGIGGSRIGPRAATGASIDGRNDAIAQGRAAYPRAPNWIFSDRHTFEFNPHGVKDLEVPGYRPALLTPPSPPPASVVSRTRARSEMLDLSGRLRGLARRGRRQPPRSSRSAVASARTATRIPGSNLDVAPGRSGGSEPRRPHRPAARKRPGTPKWLALVATTTSSPIDHERSPSAPRTIAAPYIIALPARLRW